MNDFAAIGNLANLVLGYSAVIDRQRAVVATRLTLAPMADAAAVDAAALLAALTGIWRADEGGWVISGGAGAPNAGLLLNAAGEGLLLSLLQAAPPPHVIVEVPAFIAAQPAVAQAARAAQAKGSRLALKGAAREPLADAAAYALQIEDGAALAGALPSALPSATPTARAGIRSVAELQDAFAAGCTAACGWPFGEPPAKSTAKALAPGLSVVLELIQRVEREEPAERLEAVLKGDPTLAFRLLRYINSPGFGLSVEVTSFRHALMMLGYQRLKRWLALLLASAGQHADSKPLLHAAVRRGLFLEELVKDSGDAELRSEVFICGVFSLLDRLLQQPFAELLRALPVGERVRQALASDEGPFAPYLALVRAIEAESVLDVRECAENLLIGVPQVNRALLAALAAARGLE